MSEEMRILHPIGEPLSVIHEVALRLEAMGHSPLAMDLERAHEEIETWVLAQLGDRA